MCRFLAAASRWPRRADDVIDRATIQRLVGLAGRHRDGWGLAWLDEGGDLAVVRTERSESSLAESCADGTLSRVLHSAESRYHVLHLREASPGLGRSLASVQPITAPGHALVHNGFCDPVSAMWDLVEELAGARVAPHPARTDSAYLLQLALLFRARGVERPLWEAAAYAALRFPEACLNAALLSTRGLQVVSIQPANATETPTIDYSKLQRTVLPGGTELIGSHGVLDAGSTWVPDRTAVDL